MFVRRNLVPDLGSAWFLPRAVGVHTSKELMLLGEEIDAERAHQLGIVNRLVETPEQALEEAISLAEKMTTTAPATMAMAKDLINRSQAMTLEAPPLEVPLAVDRPRHPGHLGGDARLPREDREVMA